MPLLVLKQKGEWKLVEVVETTQKKLPGCNCPKGVQVIRRKYWALRKGDRELIRFSSKQAALLFWRRRVDAK